MIVAAVFFLSGFAGLLYEVVFARTLALTFGSTSAAATSVLATYMGGMALGAWAGGGIAARSARPFRLYALAELGIAAWCALSPWLLRLVHTGWLAVARELDPGSGALLPLKIAAGALFLLPPTALMGATLPLLARALAAASASMPPGGGLGRAAGLLYVANTLGGATGALASGYVLLPILGVRGTVSLAVAANLGAAFAALSLAALPSRTPPPPGTAPDSNGESLPDGAAARIGLALLGMGGVLSFALEIVYIHLLAVVAGSTTYAFALMLAAFLVGLGAGAASARAALGRLAGRPTYALLSAAALGLSAAVLLGAPAWERIPDLFVALADHPLAGSFAGRELLRGAVCTAVMLPPAFAIGALWPLAMDLVARARPELAVRRLGRAAALNTLGNIAGSVIAALWLVPVLGSRRALAAVAAAAALLALLPASRTAGLKRHALVVLALLLVAVAAAGPAEFVMDRLAAGTSVYFSRHVPGRVIDHRESLDGGITTVTRAVLPGGTPVLTLLTNGKFQGDDNPDGEMRAQYAFALCPLLHTAARGRALVIGLGTGATTRVLADAGFARIDVAELAPDIVTLARRHFERVNAGALERPAVRVRIGDGRNVLLLEREPYDLVSIEVTSIWLAGAASLYNREFYQLAQARLAPGGVLQQWVQLHRLAPEDLVSILATLRAVFPRVWLYFVRSQGVLVACNEDCAPDAAAIEALERRAELAPVRALFGGQAAALLGTRLLTPEGVDRFLAGARQDGLDPEALISTDDNLFLEHSTPRGNVRDYESTLTANLGRFLPLRPESALEATHLRPEDFAARTTP